MAEKMILIDNERLLILKAATSVEQLEYWAELLAPQNDFTICGTSGGAFSVYTHLELRMLYSNMRGTDPGEREYADLIKMARMVADEVEVDHTEAETLRKRLGHEIPPVDPRPVPERGGRRPARGGGSASKTPTRPREGTTTAKVWAIADELASQANGMPDRNDVIKRCSEEGINPSTASTQYGKWKRAQNEG